MTTTVDEFDRGLALAATGLLREANLAGVLLASDVHVALRLADLLGETDESVMLAAALAVRAVRSGSVCVDLAEVRDEVGEDGAELAWPELDGWLAALAASPLLGAPHPLRLEETRLYLDRYWREEEQVEQDLRRRAGRAAPPVADEAALRAVARPALPRCVVRRAARGRRDRRTPVDHGAHRRTGHRQDHHGRRAAGPARRAGVDGRRAPAADRAHRADRQGRGPAGGGGPRRDGRTGSRRPTPSGSATSGRSPCTGCSAPASTRRSASATTATTGCPTT